MSAVLPVFFNRDYTQRLVMPQVSFRTNLYSKHVIGGANKASISAFGEELALWDLIEMLRCPVELLGETGEAIWWGYISEVAVRTNSIEISAALLEMFNRVAVAYTRRSADPDAGSDRFTTSWSVDTTSTGEFGIKEKLLSLADASDAQAAQTRDVFLTQRKYPVSVLRPSGATESLSALLYCHGWWDTTSWRYYSNSAGIEGYTDLSGDSQNVGEASGNQRVAQQFVLTSTTTWGVSSVRLRLKKQGAPTDNLLVEVQSESAGAPSGTILASGSVAGADIGTNLDWLEITVSPQYELQLATNYWVVVRRSGALDASNYFVVEVNVALGYTTGIFRLYNGSTWSARSPDADMNFQVLGVHETTRQITDILTAIGQFFTAIDIEAPSGVFSSPFRDGDDLAQDILEDLLRTGTSAGLRLVAEVTRSRRVRIYQEPASSPVDHFLQSDFTVYQGNTKLPNWRLPVGMWVRVRDVIAATADMSRMTDPGLMFIEQGEYEPPGDDLRLTSRGVPSPFDVFEAVKKVVKE